MYNNISKNKVKRDCDSTGLEKEYIIQKYLNIIFTNVREIAIYSSRHLQYLHMYKVCGKLTLFLLQEDRVLTLNSHYKMLAQHFY